MTLYSLLSDEYQEMYDAVISLYAYHAPVEAEMFCADCPKHPAYMEDEGKPRPGSGICNCSVSPYKVTFG